MKQVLAKITVEDELLNYILVFCFFMFPIFPFSASISLIIFSLLAIPYLDKRNFTRTTLFQYLLFNAIYIIYIVTAFYSPNEERVFDLLLRLLPIPGITVLFIFSNIAEKLNYKNIKIAYVSGVALAASIALLSATFHAIQTESWEALFYFSLTKDIHAHPVYFSLQVLSCMVILLNLIRKEKVIIPIFLVAYFTVMIVLLQSKSAFVLMLLLFVFHIFKKGINKTIKIVLGLFLLVTVLLVSKTISSDNNRFSELLRNTDEIVVGSIEEDGIQQRKWLWTTAWEHYKERPVFGYGLGSQRNLFQWKVEKSLLETKNLKQSYINAVTKISKLNLHNQYLQLLYETGLFGLSILLLAKFIILFQIRKVISSNFGEVLILFLCLLFTENMLDRQMGIYFYSFILVFLYCETKNKKI